MREDTQQCFLVVEPLRKEWGEDETPWTIKIFSFQYRKKSPKIYEHFCLPLVKIFLGMFMNKLKNPFSY